MPVQGRGVPPPGWLTMTDAVTHTGIAPMTLRRRADAWLDGRRDPYAVRAVRVHSGRLVDQLDAERARLQHLVLMPAEVDAELWQLQVALGEVPAQVTDAPWWADAVQRARDDAEGQ